VLPAGAIFIARVRRNCGDRNFEPLRRTAKRLLYTAAFPMHPDIQAALEQFDQRHALAVLARGVFWRPRAHARAWLVLWPGIPQPFMAYSAGRAPDDQYLCAA